MGDPNTIENEKKVPVHFNYSCTYWAQFVTLFQSGFSRNVAYVKTGTMMVIFYADPDFYLGSCKECVVHRYGLMVVTRTGIHPGRVLCWILYAFYSYVPVCLA